MGFIDDFSNMELRNAGKDPEEKASERFVLIGDGLMIPFGFLPAFLISKSINYLLLACWWEGGGRGDPGGGGGS